MASIITSGAHDSSSNHLGWLVDPEAKFLTGAPAPETIVRDAVPVDAPAVAAIGRAAVPETYRDLISDPAVMQSIVDQSYAFDALRNSIARCAVDADAHFLVAERGRRIVGYLHYDREGPEPELHRIYVEPALKRQGIGSGLLRELHRRLPTGASYILMVVAANRPAVSFYERHGLVEAAHVDGVAYMHERMSVEFPLDTRPVPALILRFTKLGER
jgi:ribosomal protein S18 acetylase RimI-like enzyme